MNRLLLYAVFFVAATPFTVYAQATLSPAGHEHKISTNPFGLMIEWFNAEYERGLADATSVSLSASRMKTFDGNITRATAILRYYPQGGALNGVYLGARTGYIDISDDSDGFVAGFEIGRAWLFGPRQNVSFSIGAGLDRYLSKTPRHSPNVIPVLRLLNVGVAF